MSPMVHTLRAILIVTGVVVTMSFSAASAQIAAPNTTQPAASGAAGNNWWDVPLQPGPGYRPAPPASPYASNITDYPSSQMNDWVVANAMAARARAMRTRAQSELDMTIRRVQQRLEHSGEFIEAAIADKQAYSQYVTVRQKAMSVLANDPKYHAIMQLRDELGDKIVARRGARDDEADIDHWLAFRGFDRAKLTGDQMVALKVLYDADQQKAAAVGAETSSREEIMALARLKLEYANDARAIEVSALSADDNLKAAREKMMDASKRISEMRVQFEYSLHNNPDVLTAQRNLEDARVSVVEAQALAAGASVASDDALNYAYYLHRNDNGGVYGPYGPGGSLAGYASPYWGR